MHGTVVAIRCFQRVAGTNGIVDGVVNRIVLINGVVLIDAIIIGVVLIDAIIIGVAFTTAAVDCFALKRPRSRRRWVGGCGHAWARTRGSCHSNARADSEQRWGHLCGASGQQRELCGVRRCKGCECDARLLVCQRRGGRLRRARAVTEWGVCD